MERAQRLSSWSVNKHDTASADATSHEHHSCKVDFPLWVSPLRLYGHNLLCKTESYLFSYQRIMVTELQEWVNGKGFMGWVLFLKKKNPTYRFYIIIHTSVYLWNLYMRLFFKLHVNILLSGCQGQKMIKFSFGCSCSFSSPVCISELYRDNVTHTNICWYTNTYTNACEPPFMAV